MSTRSTPRPEHRPTLSKINLDTLRRHEGSTSKSRRLESQLHRKLLKHMARKLTKPETKLLAQRVHVVVYCIPPPQGSSWILSLWSICLPYWYLGPFVCCLQLLPLVDHNSTVRLAGPAPQIFALAGAPPKCSSFCLWRLHSRKPRRRARYVCLRICIHKYNTHICINLYIYIYIYIYTFYICILCMCLAIHSLHLIHTCLHMYTCAHCAQIDIRELPSMVGK